MNQSMRTLKGVGNYASLLLFIIWIFLTPLIFFWWGGQSILLCLVTLLMFFFTDHINIYKKNKKKKTTNQLKSLKKKLAWIAPVGKRPSTYKLHHLVNLFIFSLNWPHWAVSVIVKKNKYFFGIGFTISIGREIKCHLYTRFKKVYFDHKNQNFSDT